MNSVFSWTILTGMNGATSSVEATSNCTRIIYPLHSIRLCVVVCTYRWAHATDQKKINIYFMLVTCDDMACWRHWIRKTENIYDFLFCFVNFPNANVPHSQQKSTSKRLPIGAWWKWTWLSYSLIQTTYYGLGIYAWIRNYYYSIYFEDVVAAAIMLLINLLKKNLFFSLSRSSRLVNFNVCMKMWLVWMVWVHCERVHLTTNGIHARDIPFIYLLFLFFSLLILSFFVNFLDTLFQ